MNVNSKYGMSRSSNLELNTNDSQVLDSLNSLSFPSEPSDIRNWFPSYVYESPELDTLDGFQDFDGCAETSREEKVKVKMKSNATANVGKFVDGLVAEEKGLSRGIFECNGSDEFEHGKPAVVVSGSSESLSQCSEPPDIGNWFSSYVYESPPLDTMDNFTSDYKEKEDEQVYNNTLKLCRGNDKDVTDVGEITVLPSQNRIHTAVLKCTELVENAKQDKQSVCKDGSNIDLEAMPYAQSRWISETVSDQMLIQNQNHGSVEISGNRKTGDKDYGAKFGCSLSENDTTYSPQGKYIEDSLEKEDLYKPETLDSIVGSSIAESIEKENEETEIPKNGFISTRRNISRESNNGNPRMRLGIQQLESKKNGAKCRSNSENDVNMRRRALSETTNFHSSSSNATLEEITGKWRCPQKHKPNLGPPLKQLRLERWVRRV